MERDRIKKAAGGEFRARPRPPLALNIGVKPTCIMAMRGQQGLQERGRGGSQAEGKGGGPCRTKTVAECRK